MKLNIQKRQQAFALRKAGKSYSEINFSIGISKSTLSGWFAKEAFSADVKAELDKKWKKDSKRRIQLLNKRRKELQLKRYEQIKEEARREFQHLKSDPLFQVGLSLYWGEGSKTHNGRVSVVNSDVDLLKTVAAFYRKILKIPEEKIRAEMFIYQDLNENDAKRYWAKQLNIDFNRFIKTQILPTRNVNTSRKLRYGLCTLYFSNTQVGIKILEWIKMLSREVRK